MFTPRILYHEQPPRHARPCPWCDTESLVRTSQLTSDTRKKYPCPFCGKQFARGGDLNRHKLIHTGVRPHKCDICAKAFARKDHLKNHKSVHLRSLPSEAALPRRPKKYPCPALACDKKFRHRAELRCHYRTHTGEKPFKCNFDGCERAFTREGDLRRHKLVHSDVRPHKCDICDKAFNRKDNLKNHKNTHRGRPIGSAP